MENYKTLKKGMKYLALGLGILAIPKICNSGCNYSPLSPETRAEVRTVKTMETTTLSPLVKASDLETKID